jgi:hypothetical protein
LINIAALFPLDVIDFVPGKGEREENVRFGHSFRAAR